MPIEWKKKDTETKECPFCKELMKPIPWFAKSTIWTAFVCKECDQAYVHDENGREGTVVLLPLDSKLKLINIKCETCNNRVNIKQSMIWLVNDLMIFKPYCPECAVKYIKSHTLNDFDTNQINIQNINETTNLFCITKQHNIMNNPEKMTKVKETKHFKKFGLLLKTTENK